MSIFSKLDRFRWTLVDTGQAFNAIFKVDRIGFIFFHLIDLAWTDLNTVSATRTFLLVNCGVHFPPKPLIPPRPPLKRGVGEDLADLFCSAG
jgi:hypothetical protein